MIVSLLDGVGTGRTMRRREFITLFGGVAAAWPLVARAQQGEQMRRIGVLMGAAVETDQQAAVAVFKEIQHQLGWIDGRNVRVEVRWAGGDPMKARKDAEELVALPADVIMTNGQFTLQALLQATRSVPIVFNGTVDPVGSGFIDSLARPGGNATGFVLFEINGNFDLDRDNALDNGHWYEPVAITMQIAERPAHH